MSAVSVVSLSREEARSLTDEVKHDAERLWRKLAELYEGEAWSVLGYDSWRDYWIKEFGEQSLNLSYKQIAAGRVARVIDAGVYHGTNPNERQARELAPLLDQPEQLREAWSEASSNGEPTAVQVREAVERRIPPKTEEQLERQLKWATTVNVLDGLSHFDRDPVPEQADREAALINHEVVAQRGDSLTPVRLRRASAWAALLADALERSNK